MTIDIISGCPIFTKEQYVKKHDRVCTKLQFNICKDMGVKLDSEQRYEHVPKSIQTSHGGKHIVESNRCKQKEPSLTINWASQSMIMKKEHLCQ